VPDGLPLTEHADASAISAAGIRLKTRPRSAPTALSRVETGPVPLAAPAA